MSTNPAKSTHAAGSPATARAEPEQHLARTLGLCEAQMESALNDSDIAVDALVRAFTGLAETTRSISELTRNMPPEAKALLGNDLQQQAETIGKQIANAVVAFQF